MAMNNQDAQFLQSRAFSRQDVALIFLLESIMGDDSSVSYNSLEQKHLAYLSNCLMRWLVKWEEEANAKLLTRSEMNTHYHKFNVASLLRADTKTTFDTLALGISSTILTRNEARMKLDMNTVEGGDDFQNPNITPGGSEPEPPEEDQVEAIQRNKLVYMFKIEKARFEALEPEKIPDFLESWEDRLCKAFQEVNLDPALATQHITNQLNAHYRGNLSKFDPEQVAEMIIKGSK
jgi:hypothetical protein